MAEPDSVLDRLIHSFAAAETLAQLPPVVDVQGTAPPNPPEATQAKFVGASYVTAYAEAASFVRVADEWSQRHRNRGLGSSANVVDFGSGWGRISRFLLAHVPPSALYAVDVDLEMTALVNTTLPGVNAMTVASMPPTVLRDSVTDSVLAFSVFSHLSPDAHVAWAHEFGRIVSDTGMVFLTVLDHVFLDQVRGAKEAVAGGSQEPFTASLAECFPDLDAARARYNAGEPAYAGVGGGGVLTGDFYGWAAIPKAFVERVWGEAGFDIVEWVPSGTLFGQAMVALVQRRDASPMQTSSRRLGRWFRGSVSMFAVHNPLT
jgi:hypothetical protein